MIAALTQPTQPDGAPMELKTLIDCEPRGEAEYHFNFFTSGSHLFSQIPGPNRKVDFHRQFYIDHLVATHEDGHDDTGLSQETRGAIDANNQ